MRVNLFGQTYSQSSLDLNSRKFVNLFPIIDNNNDSKSPVALRHTPGLTLLGTSSNGIGRGFIEFNNRLFGVFGNKFVELVVDSATPTLTSETTLGTLNTSTGKVYLAKSDTQIGILDGDYYYLYTVAATTFTEVVDTDFVSSSSMIQLDGYFVFSRQDSQVIFHSDLSDASSINPLNFASAESEGDNLVALFSDKGELWAFGEDTVEIWYNAANATGFTFSPRAGAYIDYGCAAKRSLTRFNNTIAWLDSRKYIVMAQGYSSIEISTEPVTSKIQGYTEVSDAIFYSYIDEGHEFLVCVFPSADKTWVYDIKTNMWHERSSTINGANKRHLGEHYIEHSGLHILSSFEDGKIFHLDKNAYLEDTQYIRREAITSHIGNENKYLGVNKLELFAETGIGLQTGNGSDPKIRLQISKDGGHTFGVEQARDLGKIGKYKSRIHWDRLGTSREWTFKFIVTDPVPVTLIDSYIDVDGV